jgi:peptidyl-prolyl cis-trans isomerase A (cyclophilin A)
MEYMTLHTHTATLHTNHGDITVVLYGFHAPKTVDNFVGLATGGREWTHPSTGQKGEAPLYNGVIFHRVIPGFMLQGGDPAGTGMGGPGYQFDDEIHPELDFTQPFILAMANAGTRGGQGTNGSQFFITTAPTPWLQGKHTIFGAVTDGESQAVVQAIEAAATDGSDRPVEDVILSSVSVTALS